MYADDGRCEKELGEIFNIFGDKDKDVHQRVNKRNGGMFEEYTKFGDMHSLCSSFIAEREKHWQNHFELIKRLNFDKDWDAQTNTSSSSTLPTTSMPPSSPTSSSSSLSSSSSSSSSSPSSSSSAPLTPI
eukprot:CAMPEP_0114327994 /NCGR_PEP_ID=MMETSP0101-20121206/119_1 /TAXON_ID=38822 ORGANISM="Pteridomonas danica, Strain PT" /NCGR_SAMPLE_ID=MMETSP0101 /ASSEMBLY_ACC=CAM_ASM_000211 /LENGTH=129 /DNA_ID=CAMNT_0001457185 /DNA_START=75 /DNA_END=464 /DNA_ORIENTATION=-